MKRFELKISNTMKDFQPLKNFVIIPTITIASSEEYSFSLEIAWLFVSIYFMWKRLDDYND
jgi:hypothetical protein